MNVGKTKHINKARITRTCLGTQQRTPAFWMNTNILFNLSKSVSTDCKRQCVDLETKPRLSGGKETFSCDALGLNRDRKWEKRSKRKETSILKNRSNDTLPAPSATQAESTPKIKYTLHLGTNSRNKMHSVKNRSTDSTHMSSTVDDDTLEV